MIEDYGIDGKDILGRTILEVFGILANGAQMGAYGNAFANGFAGAAGVSGSEGKSETSYGESSGNISELLENRPELTGTNREKLLSMVQDIKLAGILMKCIDQVHLLEMVELLIN